MKYIRFTTALLLALATGLSAYAADEPASYTDRLTGDWNGARSRLADAGVEVGLDYTGELWSTVDGGRKNEENYLGVGTLRVDLNGEKLFGIPGNTVSVAVIGNHGSKVNAGSVGSTQGVSNIEVAGNGVRVYEAWMNQEFLDGRIAVLVGLHDLNSEFAVTGVSDNFMKPTMQIGQSFAQSGANGPSVYPATSLAGRVKVMPTESTYVAAAVYDGVPGDPDHPRSNHVDFDEKDGLLLVGEVGYVSKLPDQPDAEINKVALGMWNYTARFDDQVDVDGAGNPLQKISHGAYVVSSYQFYHDKAAGRDIAGFLRGGIADGNTVQVDWDYEAGIVANGWVPSRPEGEIGLGISQAHNSDDYVASVVAASGATDRNEYSYELYYRDSIAQGIMVQPDLQFVVNPGTDTVTDTATVVGLRVDMSF